MTIEEMLALKKEKGYSYETLSKLSGISKVTIQKILEGETKKPRIATLKAIEKVLETDTPDFCVREETVYYADIPYKKRTLDDYYSLSEDRRVELIDGSIYDLAAPTTKHQELVQELFFQLESYIRAKKGKCKVFVAPIDVRILKDQYNMFQPDILVVCDKEKITLERIEGAPDLVMEVLSPATRKRDMTTKLVHYQMAGVREYWLVDPEKRMVYVYADLQESVITTIYTFEDAVPVAIYGGELKICLTEIT